MGPGLSPAERHEGWSATVTPPQKKVVAPAHGHCKDFVGRGPVWCCLTCKQFACRHL